MIWELDGVRVWQCYSAVQESTDFKVPFNKKLFKIHPIISMQAKKNHKSGRPLFWLDNFFRNTIFPKNMGLHLKTLT